MAKTQKEIAFLRDLYVQNEWTTRFTDLVDKHIDLRDSENMLYLNAGTGSHAMAIFDRFGETTDIFASCENEDELAIALDKAAAVSSEVDFSTLRFEDNAFDAVLADGSFIRSNELERFVDDTLRVARVGADIAIFLPSSGSFGEIFSLLWEVLFNENLPEYGGNIETLINELPTISTLEEMAGRAGMVNVNTQTALEVFEFENGRSFVDSPLVADFLLPYWLRSMDENEKERVIERLAQLIDAEDGSLTFRFSIKATLLTGEKG